MKLLEYESKNILRDAGVSVPRGEVFAVGESIREVGFPVVVKSQVPIGGRGKLGGIVVANDRNELERAIENISKLEIKDFLPKKLLLEEALAIKREFYLSLTINRATASIDVIAHRDGGVEVESQADFWSKPLTNDSFDAVSESLAELFSLEEKSFLLADWVEKLYGCFVKNDATLLEINPLILTESGELVAGDCKMTLDDAAAFRHPEWDFEEKSADNNFVTLDQNGTVATIANGAGLAMATVDTIAAAGLKPANFLDIGGSATPESVASCFARIVEFPNVSSIVINVFGGIVRCDDVARAILAAREKFPSLPKLSVRLSGTNSAEAAKLLASSGLTLHPDLQSCLEEITHG